MVDQRANDLSLIILNENGDGSRSPATYPGRECDGFSLLWVAGVPGKCQGYRKIYCEVQGI